MPKWHISGWYILLPFKPMNQKKLANATTAPGSKAEFHLTPIKKTENTAFDGKVKKKKNHHSETSLVIDKLSLSFPFIKHMISSYHVIHSQCRDKKLQ